MDGAVASLVEEEVEEVGTNSCSSWVGDEGVVEHYSRTCRLAFLHRAVVEDACHSSRKGSEPIQKRKPRHSAEEDLPRPLASYPREFQEECREVTGCDVK